MDTQATGWDANYNSQAWDAGQKEIAQGEGYADFELHVRPTIDMSRHLLGLGNTIKILEPEWLAEVVHVMHQEGASLYEK